ncbi:MAG: hypothetical protein QNJ36_13615 [Calothrix sp. MO_167.B42]|nr:hypothetical protein [Calothrix sp. MO_167.B42]
MSYKPLFQLSIFHEYYQKQVCPDFSIEPTNECTKLLQGHRLILKNKINGIVVIAPVDSEQKSWIELADNLRFTFILKLQNQDFINFTDINWKPLDDIYQFSNRNNNQSGVLDLEITQTSLSDQRLPKGQNIFGIVDIYNNDSMPKVLNQESEYKITFQAKKQHWYYCLVTDNLTNGDEFSIEGETEIKFTRITGTGADNADQIFSAIKQQFPDSQQYLFKSESEIACQEAGIENIQLNRKNNGSSDSTMWIKHLPNPPNNGIQVINTLKYL